MATSDPVDKVVQSILTSPKYQDLYEPTVRRIVKDAALRYKPKLVEKNARKKLHQIWGAYWDNRPSYDVVLEKIAQWQNEGVANNEIVKQLLTLHVSTQERITYLSEIYVQIFAITGIPSSIIDYGCGFNPLTVPWMNLATQTSYKGIDIDHAEITFLNTVLDQLLVTNVTCDVGDILIDHSEHADVIFLFKLLQVLEHQEKGVSKKLLSSLPCSYIVLSFPKQTIGGNDKQMDEFYSRWFRELVADQKWEITELDFTNEVVFVVRK